MSRSNRGKHYLFFIIYYFFEVLHKNVFSSISGLVIESSTLQGRAIYTLL